MTRKLLFILIYFSISTAYSQCGFSYDYSFTNIIALEKRNLKGNVQIISSEYFEALEKFGELINGELKCKRQVYYNKDKTIKEITEYDREGKISGFYKHEYINGAIRSISEYKNNGDLFAKTAFVTENNKLREQRYLPDGELNDQWFLRTLDRKGRMIKEEWKYHEKNDKSNETLFYYDEKSRIIKVETENSFTKVKYKSSSNSFPVKIETYNSDTGKLTRKKSYEFNSKGDIIKEYKNGLLIYSYDYEYDINNNWIKRTEFRTEAEIPLEIIDRQIVYYN